MPPAAKLQQAPCVHVACAAGPGGGGSSPPEQGSNCCTNRSGAAPGFQQEWQGEQCPELQARLIMHRVQPGVPALAAPLFDRCSFAWGPAYAKHHTKRQTVTFSVCRRRTHRPTMLGQAAVQALEAGAQVQEPR